MRSLSGAVIVVGGLAVFVWAADTLESREKLQALALCAVTTLGGLMGWAVSLRDPSR